MSGIRGLELLFNLEKANLKSKEDCVVAALHCILINENLLCVGIGDSWPDAIYDNTELLPRNWNNNQDVYTLRYTSRDQKSRILLKITKMEHILQVDVVRNEDSMASMPISVANYISDDYSEYSIAYKGMEALDESFRKNIKNNLRPRPNMEPSSSSECRNRIPDSSSSNPPAPSRSPGNLRQERDPLRIGYPQVGGRDLDPFGTGGGMLMDPSSFGIPSRPTLPQFGVGGPRGLPRGAVPPGARFDPFMPPIMPPYRFNPDPDHFRPPDDYDDFL